MFSKLIWCDGHSDLCQILHVVTGSHCLTSLSFLTLTKLMKQKKWSCHFDVKTYSAKSSIRKPFKSWQVKGTVLPLTVNKHQQWRVKSGFHHINNYSFYKYMYPPHKYKSMMCLVAELLSDLFEKMNHSETKIAQLCGTQNKTLEPY